MNRENSVQLIGIYGDDQVHACSAWTSISRDIASEMLSLIKSNGKFPLTIEAFSL